MSQSTSADGSRHELDARVARIEALIAKGTAESLTFAALHGRLAIEQICYERLRVAHDYISHDDLKRWQPRDVVNKLIQEVDPAIASDYTVSISKTALREDRQPTLAEFEAKEYFELGRQVGFDAKKLGKLWNGLGNFLHVRLPRTSQDEVAVFGSVDDIKKKLQEVLAELHRLRQGTLVSSGTGEIIKFFCGCGVENKRRAALLSAGQVINCVNPKCSDRWTVEVDGADINFRLRLIEIECQSCNTSTQFSEANMLNLQRNQIMEFECRKCAHRNLFMWKLMQARTNI